MTLQIPEQAGLARRRAPDVASVPTAGGAGAIAEAELDLRAGALKCLLLRSGGTPARWQTRQFGRIVALARMQLAPILDRALLAESFGREAGYRSAATIDDALAVLGGSAVDVAYAVRWLELGGEPLDERGLPTS